MRRELAHKRLISCSFSRLRGVGKLRIGEIPCIFPASREIGRSLVPVGASMNHIWRPLVEKAGYQMSDIPKTWDAFYDFFKEVQKKLRAQGMRHVYGLGFQLASIGGDSNARANDFLIAYGGQDIVTKDGKLHLDDPKVRKAAIEMLTYPTTAYKEGYVPPGAINWNDFDDNNAFHAKQIVMDLDGTISTEVAVLSQGKKDDYDDIVTMGLALINSGKPGPVH